MKNAVNLIIIFLAFTYLPLAWYTQYLLYSHVHATDLMWFLYWVNIPIITFTTIVSKIAEKLNK